MISPQQLPYLVKHESKLKIIGNKTGHNFNIGTIVIFEATSQRGDQIKLYEENTDLTYWVNLTDVTLEVFSKNSLEAEQQALNTRLAEVDSILNYLAESNKDKVRRLEYNTWKLVSYIDNTTITEQQKTKQIEEFLEDQQT